MRSFAAIALCTSAGVLVQQAAPLQAQRGPTITRTYSPAEIEVMLNSRPGCQRHGVVFADIGQELTQVAINANCANYVALVPGCPRRLVWDYRQSRALPQRLWIGSGNESFGIQQQNAMIAQARSDAAGIQVPAGTRLYRLTFATQIVGGGPLQHAEVTGTAHYGVCSPGHS